MKESVSNTPRQAESLLRSASPSATKGHHALLWDPRVPQTRQKIGHLRTIRPKNLDGSGEPHVYLVDNIALLSKVKKRPQECFGKDADLAQIP